MARTGESYSTARAQLARRATTEVRGEPTVIVPVTDMERSTHFYAAVLALPVRWTSATWTVIGDDGMTLALEPNAAAGVDLGIGVKVADLRATLAGVTAAGGRVETGDDVVARVADPDGNILRLMAGG